MNAKINNILDVQKNEVNWQVIALPVSIISLIILFSIINPRFLSGTNISNIARQASVLAIAATGQTLVILTGNIDLSQGSVQGFISVFTATQILAFGVPTGIVIGLLVAAAIGLIQGGLVAKARIPAFIVTLGGLSFLRGLGFVYSGGMPVPSLPKSFVWLGNGNIYGLPTPAVIAVIIMVVFSLVLKKTKTGRYLYAIGGNEEAAVLSGIKVSRYKLFAFLMSASLAALAGIIITARVASGQPTIGEAFELDSIAAVVIGGTSLKGGEGSLFGTFMGVILMSIIANGLNLIRVSSFVQMMVLGAIIVGAVFLDNMKRN